MIADLEILRGIKSEKELNEVKLNSTLATANLTYLLSQQRALILELIITKEKTEQERIIKIMQERDASSSRVIDTLRSLNRDPDFLQRLSKIDSLRQEYRNTRDNELSLISKGDQDEAIRLGTSLQEDRFNAMSSLIQMLFSDNHNAMDKQVALDSKEARLAMYSFLLIAAISLVLGILLVSLMNRTIALPLITLSAVAGKISGKKDLQAIIPFSDRKDEIGKLGKAFNLMLENLRGSTTDISGLEEIVNKRTNELSGVLKEVKDTVNVLAAASSEILAATTQVATGGGSVGSFNHRDFNHGGRGEAGSPAFLTESN